MPKLIDDQNTSPENLNELAVRVKEREKKSRKDQLEHAKCQATDVLAARRLAKRGEWGPWCESAGLSRERAGQYVRFGKAVVTAGFSGLSEDEQWEKWQKISGNSSQPPIENGKEECEEEPAVMEDEPRADEPRTKSDDDEPDDESDEPADSTEQAAHPHQVLPLPWKICKWAERSKGEFERYKKDLKRLGYHNFKGSGQGALNDIAIAATSLVDLAREMQKFVNEHMKEVDATD